MNTYFFELENLLKKRKKLNIEIDEVQSEIELLFKNIKDDREISIQSIRKSFHDI